MIVLYVAKGFVDLSCSVSDSMSLFYWVSFRLFYHTRVASSFILSSVVSFQQIFQVFSSSGEIRSHSLRMGLKVNDTQVYRNENIRFSSLEALVFSRFES